MKRFFNTLLTVICLVGCLQCVNATERPLVYQIDIKKQIDNTTWLYLKHGLAEAERLGAEAVLIRMNTYGGLVEAADSMRTAILYSPIPVSVFIDNNAASAGALIAIACSHIYMRKGASIGAATVVGQDGLAMPDKYQSYMRSMIRATAEAHGKDTLVAGPDTTFRWRRDPLVAEAMVDGRVVVPQLVDSTRVLTLTADEALKWRFCDGLAETADEVIVRYMGLAAYDVAAYQPSWLDNVKGFLLSPMLQSVLIMLIIGGLYFELQTPGVGFPLVVSVVSGILYFAPLYIDGLAQSAEILAFVVGLCLLVVEIFVIPGFGVAGISGIILVVGGLLLGLLSNDGLDLSAVTSADWGRAALVVLAGLVVGVALLGWLSAKIGRRGPLSRMALHADLGEALSAPVHTELIGRRGVAATVLRPSGKVRVGTEAYDGISESGFVEKGTPVRVVRCEGAQLYVAALAEDEAPAEGERME